MSIVPSCFNLTALAGSRRGAYLLVLSTVFGSSIWVTFFSGIISYKALPRQMFGNLQSKIFPAYFALQTTSSLALCGLYSFAHRGAMSTRGSKMNSILLGSMALAGALNWGFVGPWATGIMMTRHRLERTEGTTYDAKDVEASPAMKDLNTRFSWAHGVSASLNVILIVAGGAHMMFLGSHGSNL